MQIGLIGLGRMGAGMAQRLLDVGVSGGVWGLAEGFNLMIGGPPEAFRRLEPAFQALAPPDGYAHVGSDRLRH